MTPSFPEKFTKASIHADYLVLPAKEAKEALQWCLENKVEIRGWRGVFFYSNNSAPADLLVDHAFSEEEKISAEGPSKEFVGTTPFSQDTTQESACRFCVETIERSREEYEGKTELKDVELYFWLLVE